MKAREAKTRRSLDEERDRDGTRAPSGATGAILAVPSTGVLCCPASCGSADSEMGSERCTLSGGTPARSPALRPPHRSRTPASPALEWTLASIRTGEPAKDSVCGLAFDVLDVLGRRRRREGGRSIPLEKVNPPRFELGRARSPRPQLLATPSPMAGRTLKRAPAGSSRGRRTRALRPLRRLPLARDAAGAAAGGKAPVPSTVRRLRCRRQADTVSAARNESHRLLQPGIDGEPSRPPTQGRSAHGLDARPADRGALRSRPSKLREALSSVKLARTRGSWPP